MVYRSGGFLIGCSIAILYVLGIAGTARATEQPGKSPDVIERIMRNIRGARVVIQRLRKTGDELLRQANTPWRSCKGQVSFHLRKEKVERPYVLSGVYRERLRDAIRDAVADEDDRCVIPKSWHASASEETPAWLRFAEGEASSL